MNSDKGSDIDCFISSFNNSELFDYIKNISTDNSKHHNINTIINFEEIEKEFIQKEKAVDYSSSELFKYLNKITDVNKKCLHCGSNVRLFFECCGLCDIASYEVNLLYNIEELIKNKKFIDLCKEIEKCRTICKENYETSLKYIQDYKNQCDVQNCLIHEVNDYKRKQCIKVFMSDVSNDVNNIKDFAHIYDHHFHKANMFIEYKYYKLFEKVENYYHNFNAADMSSAIVQYLEHIIKAQNLSVGLKFLEVLRSNKISLNFKKNVYVPYHNLLFAYKLLNNKKFTDKFIQIVAEPSICFGSLRADYYFLIRDGDKLYPIFVELDDYFNYDKLLGGHNTIDRKARDILKDCFCYTFNISLIRLKYDEKQFDILEETIKKEKFPAFRFYDKYFDNKKNQMKRTTKKIKTEK